ncbi:hypothetical protein TNCV_270271 [Trichonephila clavipes]|nr:hypothetical protein TNCV_270271 [Trichonephila clavipes]
MLEKVIENWTSRLDYIRASRGSHMPENIFKISPPRRGAMDWEDITFLPEVSAPFVPSRPSRKMRSLISVQDRRRFESSLNVTNAFRSTSNVYIFTGYSIDCKTNIMQYSQGARNTVLQGEKLWSNLAFD